MVKIIRLKIVINIMKIFGGLRYAIKMCGIDLDKSKCRFLMLFKYLYVIVMNFTVLQLLSIYHILTALSKFLHFQVMAHLMFSIVVSHLINCKQAHIKKFSFLK